MVTAIFSFTDTSPWQFLKYSSDIRDDFEKGAKNTFRVTTYCMQGMIAGYIASPKEQETMRWTVRPSPDGQKNVDTYPATSEDQK